MMHTDTQRMGTMLRTSPKVRNAVDVTHAALNAYGRAVRTLITALVDADADADMIQRTAEHLSTLDEIDRAIREAAACSVVERANGRGGRK